MAFHEDVRLAQLMNQYQPKQSENENQPETQPVAVEAVESEPRWRVTLELNLGDLIPPESALQPHDYPLDQWAQQAVFDMLLQQAHVSSLTAVRKAIIEAHKNPDDEDAKAFVTFCENKVAIAEQAIKTFKVERIRD